MAGGRWTRWGRGSCEGWSLEIGGVFRAQVVRSGGSVGEPVKWRASINTGDVGTFDDRRAAMRSVEQSIVADMGRVLDDWTIYRAAKLLENRK